MNAETTTLLAALIAAFGSLLNLFYSAHSRRNEEHRAAIRQAVASHLDQIGRLIHETVALSTLQARATTDLNHRSKYKEAEQAAAKLKQKRMEVRYSLWGIDAGIRELTRLPSWIGHAKADDRARQQILNAGRELATALDNAIRKTYFSGQLPTRCDRVRVRWKTRRLRKQYNQFSESRSKNRQT